MCSIPAPEPFPGIDNVAQRVRSSLSELSARSRQVVTLHYLDGYSCREIGDRLGVPTGTVKRILHESRNDLRSRMGIAKGDGRRMEVIDSPRETKKGPRSLVWWINGNWPGSMFETLLAQSIALTVNKQPMTISEVGKAVDANVRFIEEAVAPLVEEELVVKVGRKYATNFIALDAEDWIEITKRTRREAAKLADVLSTHLPALQQAWENTSLPMRRFAWPESIWTMLAILVGNHGVSRNGFQEAPPPVHAGSGKRYWPGGREQVSDEHVLWCTGFDNGGTKGDPFFRQGRFWSDGLGREWTGWSDERSRVWGAISRGNNDVDSVAGAAGLPIDQARDIIARGIESGLIERREGKLRLRFPVFGPEEDEVLCPTVDAVSTEICEAILGPATANVTDAFRSLGYSHLEEHFSPWRRWLEGNVVGESLRELLKRGVLPDPGECAAVNFAMVGWTAPIRLFAWSSS